MSKKLYFEDSHDEVCYPLDYFIEKMEEDETELILYPAIPERMAGVFWCKEHLFCGDDSSDTCGNQCEEYKPRNGKNGRCRHHIEWVYSHGEPVKINY